MSIEMSIESVYLVDFPLTPPPPPPPGTKLMALARSRWAAATLQVAQEVKESKPDPIVTQQENGATGADIFR